MLTFHGRLMYGVVDISPKFCNFHNIETVLCCSLKIQCMSGAK